MYFIEININNTTSFIVSSDAHFPNTYEGRLQILQVYYNKHGHTKVSIIDNKPLSQWIGNLRSSYKRSIEMYGSVRTIPPEEMSYTTNIVTYERYIQLSQFGLFGDIIGTKETSV